MTIVRVLAVMLFSAFALSVECLAADADEISYEKFRMRELNCALDLNLEEPESEFPLKLNLVTQPAPRVVEKFVLARGSAPEFRFEALNVQAPGTKPASSRSGSGYMTRHKIHKYASIATLPLLVAEAVIGEKLDDERGESDNLRTAHTALAVGIGGLFGVETVTGAWNLWKGPGKAGGKRKLHGILMIAAGAGFLATALSAPDRDDDDLEFDNGDDSSTHRLLAYTSIGIAAFSYLHMLLTK